MGDGNEFAEADISVDQFVHEVEKSIDYYFSSLEEFKIFRVVSDSSSKTSYVQSNDIQAVVVVFREADFEGARLNWVEKWKLLVHLQVGERCAHASDDDDECARINFLRGRAPNDFLQRYGIQILAMGRVFSSSVTPVRIP